MKSSTSFLELMAFTFHRKPVATCRKAFQTALWSSVRYREIKLRVSGEQTYLGANNAPAFIFSVLRLGKFSDKNKNAGPFLSSAFTMPSLTFRGVSNNLHGNTRGRWDTFFVTGVCD
jgi:hypothetical protein